jgi:pimeloyl-ACP methyl ester carboxylesterase
MKLLRLAVLLLLLPLAALAQDIAARVTEGDADSGGVRIHYATLGDPKAPPVLMIHGFPDYWYGWRALMSDLARDHYAIAIDQRGYDLSGHPAGEDNYRLALLVDDVAAVLHHLRLAKATIVGHDWGGVVAWQLAMDRPELVDRLVIVNLPAVRNLRRELATDAAQRKASAYARFFQQDGAWKKLDTAQLVDIAVPDKRDVDTRSRYAEALGRSSIEAMVDYYRENYPREPYAVDASPVVKVRAPVLEIHGLDDPYLLPGALDGTWNLVDNELTLVTLPGVGHFALRDAPGEVVPTIRAWLERPIRR